MTAGPSTWRDRVAELAHRDRDLAVFGSAGHRYRLAPPLPEDHLVEIQHRHGFTVPDDYRTFITATGNGGAGPGYGLWPLGYWNPTDQHLETWEDSGWADLPSHPFPHTTPWNLPDELLNNAPATDAAWEVLDAYAEKIDGANWQPGLANGAIPIANLGCAIRVLLVVTGTEHGHVWIDDRASDGGIYPAVTEEHPDRMTFTDLYEDWITQATKFLDDGQRLPRLW